MTSPVRALWDAPAATPAPPRRVWRDWALVVAIPVLAGVEASVRPDVPFRWLWAVVLAALAVTLLWRRQRPLTMLAIAFAVGTVAALVSAGDSQLFTTAYFLILLYALFRWGSGRAMVLGGLLVAVGTLLTLISSAPGPGDVVGGIAVAVATATLGLAVRWRRGARVRELERVRLLEREQLARDLHDTVAHHVSAIAVQAQAGSAVADTDPAATAGVLHAIEAEASRTLREMRAMVGVLRGPDSALSPTPGLADILALQTTDASSPRVTVTLDADEADLAATPAPVAAAAFRIAQEAITNARRHAHGASRIDVSVRADRAAVRLEVQDDGTAADALGAGYGVAGMQERAALLGGACTAGPGTDGGWTVSATLPRNGGAS